MATKPALLLSPDGSFDANGRITPTITGGVLTVPGQYGNAWQVAEATTNLLANPRAGTGLNNITNYLCTTTRVTDRPELGETAAQVVTTANTGGPRFRSLSAQSIASGTFTASADVFGTPGQTVLIGLEFLYASGVPTSYHSGPTTVIPASGKMRLKHTVASSVGTITQATVYVNGTSTAPMTFWVSNVQIEAKTYATPYCDGSLGTGHAWTGTAHASPSTRTAGAVSVPIGSYLNAASGAVLVRYRKPDDPRQSSNNNALYDVGETTRQLIQSRWTGDTSLNTILYGSGALTATTTLTVAAGERSYTHYATWTESGLVVADSDGNTGTAARSVVGTPYLATDKIWVGCSRQATQQANAPVESVLFFDTALTDAEVAEYMAEPWTWGNTLGPHVTPVYPAYTSGIFSIDAAVYKTDRLNQSREDISTYITDLEIDGDADRTGSKLMCKIEAAKEVLHDSDWIAPYVTYRPETSDTVTQQMGHFRLDIPTVEYDDTVAEYTSARGSDILNVLKAVTLPETFYTPKGADVLQDIRTLISMATRGRVESNLVANASFELMNEAGTAPLNWANAGTFSGGGTGTILFTASGVDVPSGKQTWGPTFNAMQPVNATASITQTITLLGGWVRQKIWLSGVWRAGHESHRGYIKVEFLDASSNVISPATFTTPQLQRKPLQWTREYAYGTIPENAVSARVTVTVVDVVGGNPSQIRSRWDDITLQIISGTPIPEDRIALPAIDAIADTRIQSTANTDFLTAIDTRLAAAGLQDLTATFTGLLTTRPIDQENESPVNIYTERDSRIVDGVKVTRDAGNRFNAVRATKEDQKNGIYWNVTVFNENQNDPWNVYGDLGQITEKIVVQDAVSLAALRAAARKKLAEASIQESLAMAVLPDQDMTIYDIIRLEVPNRANGRWGIRKLKWGTSSDDPLVEVSARRIVIGS